MNQRQIKVAAVQFPIEMNRTQAQYEAKVEAWVMKAKAEGANLVVLPELIALDLLRTNSAVSETEQLREIATRVTPAFFEFAQGLARRENVSILAGSSPRVLDGKVVNTAFLAFPDGRSVMQDKTFLTPDEKDWGWAPGRGLQVFDAPWGRTVIMICFDSEFPVLSQQLAAYKPEVILVPSMTGDISGLYRVQWCAQARAIEHYAFVVSTGTVTGEGSRDQHCAQASLITPSEPGWPGLLARGPLNEAAMITGLLDFDLLAERRASARIYPAREQLVRIEPPTIAGKV